MKDITIINLTPHRLNFFILDHPEYSIESSGSARAAVERHRDGDVNGIPVNQSKFGEISGLPAPETDTVFVVSRIVAEACPTRNDLLIVDETVRDEKGRIIGARALARVGGSTDL